jgi:hypothetical protein
VAGNGYGFRYVMKVVGTGIQRCYQGIVYPLPSLTTGNHQRNAPPEPSLGVDLVVVHTPTRLLLASRAQKLVRHQESVWSSGLPCGPQVRTTNQSSSSAPLHFSLLLLPPVEGPSQSCCHCMTQAFWSPLVLGLYLPLK